jgi:hypothetical protein
MRALIVVESMYGNTERIAHSIAEGLAPFATATVIAPSDLTDDRLRDTDLLVLGGPTHAWGMSKEGTRRTALQDAGRLPEQATAPGLRDVIVSLHEHHGMLAAAFCTRLRPPRIFTGSAARAIGRKIKQKGFELVAPPEDFLVTGQRGPLVDGELERAVSFGAAIGAAVGRVRGRRRAA